MFIPLVLPHSLIDTLQITLNNHFNTNNRKKKFVKVHIVYDSKKIEVTVLFKILVMRPSFAAVLLSLFWLLPWQIRFLP